MAKLTCKAFLIIAFLVISVLVAVPDAFAAKYRIFEYFEGLPADYKELDWQGYNYHASDPIPSGTEKTLYGYPKRDFEGRQYTCVGWKDATGSITPQTGDTNHVTFTLSKNSSITWIYKKVHEVTFTVSSMEQTLSACGANDQGQLGDGTHTNRSSPYRVGIYHAGAANVLYGASGGLSVTGNQLWHQYRTGLGGEVEAEDQFGSVLAAGDFNGDGHLDLAIGVPGEDDEAGAVNVLYGSSSGLSNINSQLLQQNKSDYGTVVESDDLFGSALAAGDFNGDGYLDLAIGVPGESEDAGRVHVLYGSGSGLWTGPIQGWHQDSAGVQDLAESGDGFGAVLASGDFNGDGKADLAIGVPGEDDEAGAVNVLYGSSSGLSNINSQLLQQNESDYGTVVEANDQFGSALAAGDFNGDGYLDLAIGVPGESEDAGRVHVLYGSGSGLWTGPIQGWHQDSAGVQDLAESGDGFGAVLASGDFNGDGKADLAIGVPGEDDEAGAVNVLYGSNSGLSTNSSQLLQQNESDYGTEPEANDQFGSALAAGDFNGDGYLDLAIGVPGESEDAGRVHVLYGSGSGLWTGPIQGWHQDSAGVQDLAESGDGFGAVLASGDFNGDGKADLAVGVKHENIELPWAVVAAGAKHTVALEADGSLWVWGDNEHGQLGLGDTSDRPVPTQVGGQAMWHRNPATGHEYALTPELTWQEAENYAVFKGGHLVTVNDATENNFLTDTFGSSESLWIGHYQDPSATTTDWGYRWVNGETPDPWFTQWQIGEPNDGGDSIESHQEDHVVMYSPSMLWYDTGGSGSFRGIMERPEGADAKWIAVAAAQWHTLGIKPNGTLWAWGRNDGGQLGLGDNTNRSTPTQVGRDDKDDKWVAVYAGGGQSFGLKSDGTLWAWGWNASGQLGIGTWSNSPTPTQVQPGTTWLTVAAGYQHTLGLKSSGRLYAWGHNEVGQLGVGDYDNRHTPNLVVVGPPGTWQAVGAGYKHSLAVRSDGTLWAWGKNDHGALGLGDFTNRNTPTQVGQDDEWISVTGGTDYTLAIRSDGTLWAWGLNGHGQLGNLLYPETASAGWIGNPANGREYALTPQLKWTPAEAHAVSLGGHLVTINDQAENDWLALQFPEELENLWIGFWQQENNPGFSEPAGGWKWVSGETPDPWFTLWDVNEPNNDGGEWVGVLKIAAEGKWNDLHSNYTFRGIMERPHHSWTPLKVGSGTDWISVSAGNGTQAGHSLAIRGPNRFELEPYIGPRYLPEGTEIIASAKVIPANDWEAAYNLTTITPPVGEVTSDGNYTWVYKEARTVTVALTFPPAVPQTVQNAADAFPAIGESRFADGSTLTLHVETVVTDPDTYSVYVCTGWTAETGNIPYSGTASEMTIGSLENNSSITWTYAEARSLTTEFDGLPEHLQDEYGPQFEPVGQNSGWDPDGPVWSAAGSSQVLTPTQYIYDEGGRVRYALDLDGSSADGDLDKTGPDNEPDGRPDSGTITFTADENSTVTWTYKKELRLKVGVEGLDDPQDAAAEPYSYTYYEQNSFVTVSALAQLDLNKDGNIDESYKDLMVLSGSIGSPPAPVADTADGRKETSFLFTEPTELSWSYEDAERWVIGRAIDPPPGADGAVEPEQPVEMPDAFFWDDANQTLYAVQPFASAVLKWTNQTQGGADIEQTGYAVWPSDATLWAWGLNINGQLGFDTAADAYVGSYTFTTLVTQAGSNHDWKVVAGGEYHTVAIDQEGRLWAWGSNYWGQLGLEHTIDKYAPEEVGSDTNWVKISVGAKHTLALKANGELWAWGLNNCGQLGFDTASDEYQDSTQITPIPTKVGTATDWVTIAAGGAHSLGIRSDGTLWAWGSNGQGQLGPVGSGPHTTPTQVGSDTDWIAVAAGSVHTLALKKDGTLYAWGYNTTGAVGSAPGTTGWVAIAAGDAHSLGIRSNGTLWAWGLNNQGQLGFDTASDAYQASADSTPIPTQVGTATHWIAIAGGYRHSLAVRAGGTLWAWGLNNQGQLGLDDTDDRPIPTRVGTDIYWSAVAAGYNHTVALKSTLQKHVAGTPANLQPPDSPNTFEEMHYSEAYGNLPGPTPNDPVFDPTGTGKSLLRFSTGAGDPPLFVVVESVDWETMLWTGQTGGDATSIIGEDITPPGDVTHDAPEEKNGYIFFEKAYYDGVGDDKAYDRSTREGQIIPVNETTANTPTDRQMVVVWYETGAAGAGWPVRPVRYLCQWPQNPEKIIIASGNGSEPLTEYEYLGKIYVQPDPDQAGYNPNEEHALLLGNKAFALRNDLNNLNGETTSDPYVLLKYWYADTESWKMKVFRVEATGRDSAGYHNFYCHITAGKPIVPLMLDLLPKPQESYMASGADWYHQDHKGGHWAKGATVPTGLDVVAGNYEQPHRLYLNSGNGTFAAGSDITLDAHETASVAVGDVDGDGDLDVVAGNWGSSNRLYLNNGDGTFAAGTNITPDSHTTRSVALGDVDGDGDLDVVAGNHGQPNLLYLNNGDGTFAAGSDVSQDAHGTRSVALGDMDGDGDLDVVAGNYFNQPNRLYLNNGDDTFADGSDITSDNHDTASVALGDMDGDGDLDVVAGNYNQVNRLYLNNGDGTFAAGTNITPDSHKTYSVALGDVDGDGDLDVVAGNSGINRLYLNGGDGTFAAGTNITPDSHTTFSVALGDVDGDGDLDVVAGNSGINRLYLNGGDGTFANGSDITSDVHSTESVALGYVRNASIITMHWYYPLQSGFYYPFRKADGSPVGVGDPIPFLNGGNSHDDYPTDVAYVVSWPDDVKTLNIGETLTEAKYDLPDIVNWAAGRVIFDENVQNGGGSLARLFDPYTERSVPLSALPDGLKTENVEGKLRFPDLPYSLRSRLFYDPTNEKLIFKGISYDPGIGEPLLLPNIMTVREKERLIDFEPYWRNAVEDLFDETRNYIAGAQKLVGVPMALSAGAADGQGYLVLAENDDESLEAAPVALHVIKVAGGPYRGEIKVITPDNVFDEKLTLRHSGDFGGEPEKLYFAWYYKPDNSGLPPPLPESTTDTSGWVLFDAGQGMNDITIEGAGKLTLSDNWFMVHYYYGTLLKEGDYPDVGYPALDVAPSPGSTKPMDDENNWNGWGGAPGGETAQLAPGWIKRVVADLNPLDARVKDFRNYAVSTDVSMVTQLGQRYEGDIALSGAPENLNNLGLIEAYETVMGRAKDFSIDAAPPSDYGPVNNAILNAGTRIADFYTLLGNDAYADAQDPTIGFDTQSGALGSMASSIFAFQNQLSSLLEEELALLRGRDDTMSTTRARPVYNRLVWNFTQGDGELAYAQAYNVRDMDESGVVDELDAKRMYPQGHGDAWGHYLTAMKVWYGLLKHDHFTWEPRIESVLVGGAPIPVDYLDERKFAETAAAKARAGAEIVNLTYRRSYVEDPAGQWQGYKDTDEVRAWGVDGWARRAGQGAFFDWAVANAMLPSEDPVTAHTGIQKIDRSTVPELASIATEFQAIQTQADRADRGLNPLGLAKGVVPFDIDPNFFQVGSAIQSKTHFEQVYDRAVGALENARTVFDYATQYTLMLRQNEDALVTFKRGIEDQERDYTNRLIEIFGYPYEGDIGPTGTYKSGYIGPDLFHFVYVDLPDLTGEPLMGEQVAYTYKFDFEDEDFQDDEAADPLLKGLNVTTTTDGDNITPSVEITYHIDSEAPWLPRPAGWGKRRAPGEIQTALSELIKAHSSYKQGLSDLEGLIGGINAAVDILEAKHEILADQIDVIDESNKKIGNLEDELRDINSNRLIMRRFAETLMIIADNIRESSPEIKATAGLAGALPTVTVGSSFGTLDVVALVIDLASIVFNIAGDTLEHEILKKEHSIAKEERDLDRSLFVNDARFEVQQMVKELETMEGNVRAKLQELYGLKEVIHQSFGRYQAALAEGERLLSERDVFRKRAAADVQDYRYQDLGFRTFRNDAVQKYRATFELAARYAYLSATAYDYETNLLGSETASGRAFLTDIVKQRSPGVIMGGKPVVGKRGLADPLARLSQNFQVYKGQLGFNNPQTETNRFALRKELFRFKASSEQVWQAELGYYRKNDLWEFAPFKRFCRPFADESIGPQPGLVIPFSTEVNFGYNFFGWPLGGGDSAYDPSNFATKIRSVGVWFKDYENAGLSSTPRVYLVPVGADVLRAPGGDDFTTREWHVVDQKLPVPFPVSDAELYEETWIPVHESLSDTMGGIRRFSSFRAFPDSDLSNLSEAEIIESQSTTDTRLIGRSVWNTQWLLIIPGGTLLADPDAGLDAFIENVTDIKLFFQTYAYSGN